MKPQKFMIYGDSILLGRVNLHRELLPAKPDYSQIFGGGMFMINHDEKTIHLHGYSSDFGSFSVEKAKTLPFDDPRFKGYTRTIQADKYES